MSADQLRLFVERIERLMGERTDISVAIREVYGEAKACGYDVMTIRRLIARRAMEPHHRQEADAQLATYEAALGMVDVDPEAPLIERRPDAAALALELLTAELVALEDKQQATSLVEHVLTILDIRGEIAMLRAQERLRRAMAKDEGFDTNQVGVTVRWFERVAKHGEEAMRAGEATFHLYRGTVEDHQARAGMETERDRALMDKFAGGSPKPKADKEARAADARAAAIAMAELARKAREG